MSRPIVYVSLQQFCEYDERPRQVLLEAGFDIRHNSLGRRLKREELSEALHEVDAVIAGVEPYDAASLATLPRLRCISRCGSGTDTIDLVAAGQRQITVLTTPDEVVEPVAQLTVAMILALARQLSGFVNDAHAGLWKKRTGVLLSEWTIGLIGFGRIGRAVERHLRTFGPCVLVTDPHVPVAQLPSSVKSRDLPALLSEADVVSLHVSRSREEGTLIGQRELAIMKSGSYLINTARGFLVDEEALYQALSTAHLAGAALDVYEIEPYTGPLMHLPQVICTPHIASLTRASRTAMELRCAQNVVDFFSKVACSGPSQSF